MPNPSTDGRQDVIASARAARPETVECRDPAAVDHDDRLILWMLRRTPAERLETLQNFVEGVTALQYARKIPQ